MKKILLLLLVVSALNVSAAEFCRIYNVVIALPDKPFALQKAAAAELKTHLSKILTKPLQLNGKTPDKITMFIGWSKDAEKAGFAAPPAAETLPGKFAVYRRNNDFLFHGFDSPAADGSIYNSRHISGSFFAVSYFLRKYMTVKFIMPGNEYIVYRRDAAVKFPAPSDIPRPSYKVRHFGHGGKNAQWRDSVLWYRRQLGEFPSWARADYGYMFINSWNKRFKDRKEFFALHDNRRINASYPYHFPCTSNPDVIKQIVADIKEVVKKRPNVRNIRFFCDAPVKSCECSNCRNSPAGKFVTGNDHSETVYALLSQVGHELHKTYPDMSFHTQTKGESYHQPPRSIKLPENVVISILTAHFAKPDYDFVRQKCTQWRQAGAHVLVKSYPRAPEMKDYPIMNPHRIAEYYRELAGFMDGSYSAEGRGTVHYSFSALNNYVHSHVMFDSSVDVDELIREFCESAAPGAGRELQKFYDCMEKLQASANFRDDPLMNCYVSFRLKEPRRLLNEALRKAPAGKFLQDLDQAFAEFEKKSFECSGSIKNQAEMDKIFRGFAERQVPLKLTTQDQLINFRQFSFYRDYQSGGFKIRRDKDNIVITVNCREKNLELLTTNCKVNHQDQIWNDDCIEIFFGKKGQQLPYLHITVNALGVYRVLRCDGKRSPEQHSFPLTTKANIDRESWNVTITIPVKALQEYTVDNSAAMAIYRSRPARNNDKNQMSGIQKPLNGAFRDITGRFEVSF